MGIELVKIIILFSSQNRTSRIIFYVKEFIKNVEERTDSVHASDWEFRELLSNHIVYFLCHVLHVRTGHIPQTSRYRFNFFLNNRNWVSLHRRLR